MFLATLPSTSKKTIATLSALPSGVAGVRATLNQMRALVRDSKKNMNVRGLAMRLTGNLQQKNFLGEIKSLHRFVRDNIRYLRDITDVETLQTPEKTIEFGQGDCDDKSTLLAALLESIGHPSRFVAIGKAPGKFTHVYVETLFGNRQWLPLETTEPVEAGWAPKNIRARMIVHN